MPETIFNPTALVRHPFATIQASDASQSYDLDNIALILPIDAVPLPPETHEDFIPVNMDEGIIYWRGVDGRVHALSRWHEQTPCVDPIMADALMREQGLLVCFIDPGDPQPQRWTIFKCR